MIQFNLLLWTFLIIFAISSVFRWILTRVNISHLRKVSRHVPEFFKGEIDNQTLSKMTDYTVDSSRFDSIANIFDDIVILVILLSGFLPWLVSKIFSCNLHFVLSGFIFFVALALIKGILDIPFSLYGTFVIEKNYGFSTISPKLWASDLLKNLVISALIMASLLGPLLSLIYYAEKTWWLWVWMFFGFFQLLILWLYPIIIAPLFNKYEPIGDHDLKERIISIAERVGIKVGGIYQVDAGKRSRHTNAYFTGMGKTKRIVLYDTLLKSHTAEEILSVLAHEIGHWKKKHIMKQLVFIEVCSFFAFYLAYRLIEWPVLYRTFGFEQGIPYVGLFLLAVLFKPIAFFLTPIGSMISRRFEQEADDYSYLLIGTTQPLCGALRQLAKDNLANLFPHPLFVWFYYSHPPLAERIARLQNIEREKRIEMPKFQ
ncbi:MAG: M48 family metallopeptidase [Deltaproteobacteria bacterium]|nr:M48 family metallopeptidase [Deltaproteobacteria bacterium]